MRTIDDLARDLTYALGIPHARAEMREHLECSPRRVRVAARNLLPERWGDRVELKRRPGRRPAVPALNLWTLPAAMDELIAELRARATVEG